MPRSFKDVLPTVEQEREHLSNAYIESLGGVAELRQALAAHSKDANASRFLADMVNPRLARWSISALAHRNGIAPMDLAEIWRKWNLAKTMTKLHQIAPIIADELYKDVVGTFVVCARCDGWGEIDRYTEVAVKSAKGANGKNRTKAETKPCPNCDGAGRVRQPGSMESKKLVFKSIGLLQEKAAVNINNTFVMPSIESAISDIERAQQLPEPSEAALEADYSPVEPVAEPVKALEPGE